MTAALPLRRPGRRGTGRCVLVLLAVAVACGRARDPGLPPLRVGTSADYPPFSAVADGDLQGLDVEIARRFAHDTGRRLEFVRLRWPDLRDDLAAGKYDVAMGGVTMRPERALAGTFTRPVAATGAVVLVRRNVRATLADLDRPPVRMAVNAGGHLERVARRLFPHASIVTTTDNVALPWLLESHAADALVTDDVEADVIAPQVGGSRRLGPLTHDRKAYLGADRTLIADLDAWLRAREADGTLATLRARWLGPTRAGPRSAFASDLEALLALTDLRLAFMPTVAAAKKEAGLPIDDPRQEETILASVRAAAPERQLDPDTAVAFFRAQIAAAGAVQRTFLALPPAARPPVDRLDLVHQIRPALATLSEEIVARAADVASDPQALAALDPAVVSGALDASLVPAAHRDAIAIAVKGLRRTLRP